MLKILYITARSDQGGGPKHLYDLASGLKKEQTTNIKIYIASPDTLPFGLLFKTISDLHFSIPARSFSLARFIMLLFFIKKNQIYIIHSHGRGAGIYSRLLKLLIKDVKVIHTYHGIHFPPGIMGRIKIWIDRLLVRATDFFIYVSQSEMNFGVKLHLSHPQFSIVIHNGVNIPTSTKKIEYNTSNSWKFCSIARLSFQKGFDIGIHYFSMFKSEFPLINWTWHIAGDGEDNIQLQEQVQKEKLGHHICFVGEQSPKNFLLDKDLFISFSRWEGLPLAPLEALALSTPTLLSQVIGNTDIIHHLPSLLSFKIDTYQSFKEALLYFINNQELVISNLRQQQELMKKSFSIDAMVEKTLKLYSRLQNKQGRDREAF